MTRYTEQRTAKTRQPSVHLEKTGLEGAGLGKLTWQNYDFFLVAPFQQFFFVAEFRQFFVAGLGLGLGFRARVRFRVRV